MYFFSKVESVSVVRSIYKHIYVTQWIQIWIFTARVDIFVDKMSNYYILKMLQIYTVKNEKSILGLVGSFFTPNPNYFLGNPIKWSQ